MADNAGMSRLQLVWQLFQITIWALVAILVAPNLLSYVGWDACAQWLRSHAWVRWATLPVMLPLFILSMGTLHSVRRVSDTEPDVPDETPAVDPGLGLRESDVTRWATEGHVIEAATWAGDGERRCVATATVSAAAGFGFSARSGRLEPAWMRGAAQKAFQMGIDRGRKSADAAQAVTWEGMAFLAHDPVDLRGALRGCDVVLRTNQPDQARELLSDPDVERVITELEGAGKRWEWSLLPSGGPGEGCLRFECHGRLENPELAAWAQTLMAAALVRLARMNAIRASA